MVTCGYSPDAGMPCHLLIDADDTLWENNVYFEQAFEEFVDYLGHSRLSAAEIRAVLDEIETVNSQIHGYGSANFARNLQQCYAHLAEREIRAEDLARIMRFGERLLDHPMEVIEGVGETLEYLAERHTLVLFTKGHPDEQKLKIDRSGLGSRFHHTAIVKEKDAEAYRKLVSELDLEPARTWMIGNSPKSDVNAALEAGLGAVFIPHAHTWTLEREAIREGNGRLIQLTKFSELREHF
jgi:putative hydrolase of the HAD superfamily